MRALLRIGRMLALAGMSFAALALGGPTAAGAAQWTWEGVPLEENAALELSGPVTFENKVGNGFHCEEATASLLLEPGETGNVVGFTTQNPLTQCEALGFFKNFACQVKNVVSEGKPWAVHAKGGAEPDILITGFKVTYQLQAALCTTTFGSQITLEGELTLIPNDPKGIFAVGMSGALETPKSETYEMVGSLFATPTEKLGIE